MKLYNISINSLRRRKGKTILLVLGLTIAISTVVTLVMVSQAMNADIARKLDEFGANIVIVPKSEDLSLSYGGMTVSGVSLNVQKLSDRDVDQIRAIKNRDNIKIVAPKLLSAASVMNRRVLVVGVNFVEEVRLKKWWKHVGAMPSGEHEGLLGADVKDALQLGPGQSFTLDGQTFKVAGVLEPTGSQDDGVVFIDLREAQALFHRPNQVSVVDVAALCYDCPIEEIVRQTSEKLPGAKVMAIRQTLEAKMEAMQRFEHFSYGVSAIVLLVASLIVMTNMTASVNERTREIGVFRALGFRQSHVMTIILIEALLTSSLSGVAGDVLGLVAARVVLPLLAISGEEGYLVNYGLLALSFALAVLIGLVSSIYPAYKASRLDPSVALMAL